MGFDLSGLGEEADCGRLDFEKNESKTIPTRTPM